MKLLATSFCLLVTGCTLPPHGPVTPPQAIPKFRNEVDRFTGQHEVSWLRVGQGSGLYANFVARADKSGSFKGSTPVILLTRYGRSWKYLKCHDTFWLADGKRVATLDTRHDGSVYSGGVNETIISQFSYEQFQTLAAAQNVEYKVCNDEFMLYPAEMEGLKQVGQAIATSSKPR